MQSKTLTNRSHLALFRYAVSHPYLFTAVSRTHTHTLRRNLRDTFRVPENLNQLFPSSLSAAFISTKPHAEFTQEISKVEWHKRTIYMRIEGIVQWHRLAMRRMSMDSMEPMKCLQTSEATSRLCLLFSILPPSSSFLLRTRNQ